VSFLETPRSGLPARAANPNAKKNIPTEQSQARENARLPGAYAVQGRSGRNFPTPGQRPLEIDRQRRARSPLGQAEVAHPVMSADGESAQAVRKYPFPKSGRILKTAEFRQVYDQGFRFTTRLFTAFCRADMNRDGAIGPRFGFTVPRALGPAVRRNRIKRRMREAIRMVRGSFAPQWDIVINPRRSVFDAPFSALEAEVRELVNRCKW
jgi:ribonuclease P protein component